MTELGRHGSAKDKDVEEAARPEPGLVRNGKIDFSLTLHLCQIFPFL